MTAQLAQPMTINPQELTSLLEPLIRKVIREELAQVTVRRPDVLHLRADSPLREDHKVWGGDQDSCEQAALLRSIREELAPYVVQAMDVATSEEDWEALLG